MKCWYDGTRVSLNSIEFPRTGLRCTVNLIRHVSWSPATLSREIANTLSAHRPTRIWRNERTARRIAVLRAHSTFPAFDIPRSPPLRTGCTYATVCASVLVFTLFFGRASPTCVQKASSIDSRLPTKVPWLHRYSRFKPSSCARQVPQA